MPQSYERTGGSNKKAAVYLKDTMARPHQQSLISFYLRSKKYQKNTMHAFVYLNVVAFQRCLVFLWHEWSKSKNLLILIRVRYNLDPCRRTAPGRRSTWRRRSRRSSTTARRSWSWNSSSGTSSRWPGGQTSFEPTARASCTSCSRKTSYSCTARSATMVSRSFNWHWQCSNWRRTKHCQV